ncbi:MAG: nitrous oxide reductase family maturation protein NosD [Planctomycetota bacterium]|nr:nitrous oxide reductase family maturation protein NosD [Planctomycetota bacterium]
MPEKDTIVRTPLFSILICSLAADAAPSGPREGPLTQPVAVVAEMIDRAEDGEVLLVPAGRYEGNLTIQKSIILDGGGAAVFDGCGVGTVIDVLAEDVTIRGCTVRGSGATVTGEPSAIRVSAPRATIESNTINDALFGIDLREAPDSIIRENRITCKDLEPGRRGDGIRLWWSHGSVIEGNHIRGSRDMVFWYSENLRVARNTVSKSRYGLHFMYSHDTVLEENDLHDNSVGVYLMYSNRITLRGNQMRNHRGASGYGIGLKDCDDISIVGNALLSNRVGVYIDNSPSSVDSTGLFDSNLIAFNEIGLLATPNTHDNVFTSNAFIENEEPAATHGRGRLLSNAFSRDGVGNYWSDYTGFDLDGDGVGDMAYEPRSLFGALLAKEPNLRLFIHSPAQQAVEFTARALPEVRPEPIFVDAAPLFSPPELVLESSAPRGSGTAMALFTASLLFAAALGLTTLGVEQRLVTRQTGGRT